MARTIRTRTTPARPATRTAPAKSAAKTPAPRKRKDTFGKHCKKASGDVKKNPSSDTLVEEMKREARCLASRIIDPDKPGVFKISNISFHTSATVSKIKEIKEAEDTCNTDDKLSGKTLTRKKSEGESNTCGKRSKDRQPDPETKSMDVRHQDSIPDCVIQ